MDNHPVHLILRKWQILKHWSNFSAVLLRFPLGTTRNTISKISDFRVMKIHLCYQDNKNEIFTMS